MLRSVHRYVLWSTLCGSGYYPTEKNWTLLKKHLVLNLPPSHLSHCIAVLGRVAVVQTGARAGAGVLEVCPVHPRHSALSNP